jgi:hypothetical protein
MRWFKHDTTALQDPRIKKLIMRTGILGYGIYFAVLERIAAQVTATRQDYTLDDDLEILAHEWSMELADLKKIIKDCIDLELFTLEDRRITCRKLSNRLDEYMKKVSARAIKNKSKHVEEIVKWHRAKVEEIIGAFTIEPDMDAWYLGMEDVMKGGAAIEDIQETIEWALKQKFFKDKVRHGGKLKENYDTIRMNMDKKFKPEENRYDGLGL